MLTEFAMVKVAMSYDPEFITEKHLSYLLTQHRTVQKVKVVPVEEVFEYALKVTRLLHR